MPGLKNPYGTLSETHLGYLPMVKIGEDGLKFVAERDPRMIFDEWWHGL